MDRLDALIAAWDGEAVVARFDRPTGTWIFVALHSSVLGPATGGTRLRAYDSPAAGLADAMRLAEGMTCKWAMLDLPKGGGKAVLAVPGPLEGAVRRDLLHRYGELVESLRGAFGTGEDLGTTPDDMAVVAERTRHVHGTLPGGSVTDPGPFTARGVFAGLRAATAQVFDREELEGLRVLVQGVGDVGGPLCHHLAEAGARLLVSDVDQSLVEAVADETRAEVVPVEAVYDTECDVFAPCAIGGILSADTVGRLRCRLVAGSANNQLATADDAIRLHERGIVYAPDYVINGGGALAFARHSAGEHDLDLLLETMDSIGPRISSLLEVARAADESPATTARRQVEAILRERRAES